MTNDYYVRPIQPSDFEGLLYLAEESGVGFTSLQPDRAFLENKIRASCESFANPTEENKEALYFFVCEHVPTGKLVGCSALKNNIGTDVFFYCFKVSRLSRESKELNKRLEHRVMTLSTDYQGAVELCSLLVLPPHRSHHNGELLSRFRHVFMASFPERFNEVVISHMRGVCDEQGASPFWEALGRNFFDIDYAEADYLIGIGKTQFISDLMPTSRLYISLLTNSAQTVIGKVHPHSNVALKLLNAEGFRYRGYIDIFDAGPVIEAMRPNIKTYMDQRLVTVAEIRKNDISAGSPMLLTSTSLDFRALVNHVEWKTPDSVVLSNDTAKLLNVTPGQSIRLVPINGKK